MTDADARARWDRAVAWAAAAAVAAMCALAAWRRWRFLDGSPYPMGVDGYFYAGQLRSILEHGHLAWPASPLAFWLMAPLAAMTDPIVGAKLGAALGGALAGVPAYALASRLARSRGAGVLACAIITTAAGSFYLSVEFVKQGLGVTIALAALVAIARALERPDRGRIAIAAGAVVAAFFTHKLAAGLVLVIGVPAIVVELHQRRLLDARRLRIVGVVVLVVAGVVALLGALFPERFLALRDLRLAAGVVGGPARWELPALDLGDHALWIGHEARNGAIAAALLVAAVALVRPRPFRGAAAIARPADRAIALGLAGLALVIALPWLDVVDAQGLGFRLRLVAFMPLAIAGAVALGMLARMLPRAWWRPGLLPMFATGWLVAQPATRDEGVVRAHPALVAAVRALDGVIPRGDVVVVTERHIAFMAAYYPRVPVSLDPGSVPRAHRWRLMPLFFVGSGSAIDRALLDARAVPGLPPPRGLHPRNPDGLVLVAEPTWEWVLAQLPARTRAWAQAWHTI